MGLQRYQDVIDSLKKKNRTKHLLLGNGFSMAYDSGIFSYNALSRFIETIPNPLLKRLFEIIKTNNFELIMQQLDNFCQLAKEFSKDDTLETQIQEAIELLKSSLIDAITALHPEHVFRVPEDQSESCANFLGEFLNNKGHIFTTNYDLLLYWVLMRNKDSFVEYGDGFGRILENPEERMRGEDAEYSELIWGKNSDTQNVHYLHGTLPFFDTGIDVVKEEYSSGENLIDRVKARIEQKEYPIFVTAGDGSDKLTHIYHNQYLTYCYNKLCSIGGSLVTFGFNFGPYDEHIISAINKAAKGKHIIVDGKDEFVKLLSVYIGVYSEDDHRHIKKIEDKFDCKVNLYDAKTADIWDACLDKYGFSVETK